MSKQDETINDATYFINIHTPTLNKIVGRTGNNNELLVCESHYLIQGKYNPETKGYEYEYKKDKATDLSLIHI